MELDGGRVLSYDDVGDPRGTAVVYLHGTPDSRLARHPDDGVAERHGVRLLAIDRPGFGGTTHHDARDQLGHDLLVLLERLEIAQVALLGWSSGGLAALATAPVLAARCRQVILVATLPPVEAYSDPDVMAALGPQRRGFAEMALDTDAGELAAEVATYVVPLPITAELAREHVWDGAGEVGRAELASVPGALERLVDALILGVSPGIAGIETDLRQQLQPGLDLREIGQPVRLVHGELDATSPPAVGGWLASHLPDASLEVVPRAGHHLLFTQWENLMRSFVEDPAG